MKMIDDALRYERGFHDGYQQALKEVETKFYTTHEVACIIADLFGDDCACNNNDIDEWLPDHCDFRDTCCPHPVGVACWEQYLKNLKFKSEKSEV